MNCQFSFGPEGSYFCSAGPAFKWGEHNLPVEFARLLQNRNDPHALLTPYDVAFPPSEPGMFAGCWKSVSGEDRFYVPGNYMRLARLIKSVGTNFGGGQATRTVFGHDGSFFSISPRGCSWQNLPEALEDDIKHSMRMRRPICVALGSQKAYVVLYTDGNVLFDLHGYYPTVEAMIRNTQEATRRGGLTYVSLNPHVADEFYAAFGDGSTMWNLPKAWNENVIFVSRHIQPLQPVATPPVAKSPGGTVSTPLPGVNAAPGGSTPPPTMEGSTDTAGGVSVGHPVPVATDTVATSPGGTPTHAVEDIPAVPSVLAPFTMPDSSADLGGGPIGKAVPATIAPLNPSAVRSISTAAPAPTKSKLGWRQGVSIGIKAARGLNSVVNVVQNPNLVTTSAGQMVNNAVNVVQNPTTSAGQMLNNAENALLQQVTSQPTPPATPGGSQFATSIMNSVAAAATHSPRSPSTSRSAAAAPASSSSKSPKLGWRQGVSMGIKVARGLNRAANVVEGQPAAPTSPGGQMLENLEDTLIQQISGQPTPPAIQTSTVGLQMLENMENAYIQQDFGQQTPPANAQVIQ
ncbi:hypothetical protein DFH07DRAFT_226489 [Mycena maculata]|uniref:Uncharacterized protein n=1 Tax=Mycena maculata TaxID=230809 RepID=A0AAD7NQV3_9AGAR|nr:hypothetical protein DFH07DRAFT_226489 [Mycena maculata]